MWRYVYGQEGDSVLVMDVRDLMHGDYSVEILVDGGYKAVYFNHDLEKCIAKAKEYENR